MSMRFKFAVLTAFIFLMISCDDANDTVIPEDTPTTNDRLTQVVVNTNNQTIVDEPKINGTISISNNDIVSYEGAIGIEFRGASSQALFPKKSYGFETRDENNEDLNVSLLNLPEEEDWILYAPYSDKSLLRNVLIYDLSRDINMYASRTEFVELTVNDTYRGVYVFMEKLKRDTNRIAINKLNDDENTGEDLTGGYILKIDKTEGNNLGEGYNDLNSFTSTFLPLNAASGQEINFLYEYPDAEDITSEQKTYISNYMSDFENALASDDFKDPITGYQAYIDVPSFIDFFLLNELSHNVDGYRLSTYMHKDKNEKLKMGPIWDFNLAFGNANYCGGDASNTWAYKFNDRCSDDFWLVPFWWERLLEDPAFVDQLKERWNVLRGSFFSEVLIMDKIDVYVKTLIETNALSSNFIEWPVLGQWVWPNSFVGNTYSEETGYLKIWISNRLSWLDTNINAL